ncbi:MAG TPA: aspartate-semialdehyde dehydrogenase [Acidobacteriota bacterium]|nr:aspartate-semialdehyde dehydrogenase [Acidobacteriota bacterium]
MAVPSRKIPVAVLGATGLVGQRMISLLDGHPWFELAEVAASERSAGRPYAEAADWKLPGGAPRAAARMIVKPCDPRRVEAAVVLSALDSSVAGEVETAFRAAGRAVVTNAKNHRADDDVPLVVPEINADHLALIDVQRRRHGGFIVANANCSVIPLAIALAPLQRAAGVKRAIVTTLQAASGAGYPGVPSLDLIDNVVPYIGGQEREKIESEPLKILGALAGDRVAPAPITISAQVHRVPVIDGHLVSAHVETERPLDVAAARAALASFRGAPQELGCPSAPDPVCVVLDAIDRPQPRLDREAGRGMAVTIGQLRACPVLGLHLSVLGHNTLRGAAGGTLLVAETLAAQGRLA